MQGRFMSLLRKELIQFYRDRVMLVLILWLYTVEVVICAYALTFDVNNLPLAVLDNDRSPQSRALIERFMASEAFVAAGYLSDMQHAGSLLDRGAAARVLVLPREFSQQLQRGQVARVQLLLDGSNSNTATLARGYALRIIQEFSRSVDQRTALRRRPVEAVTRTWYNPSQSYQPFVVLSMIALAALMVGMIHPAASMVREKESGTIEQLLLTPASTAQIFLAKTLPTAFTGLLALFPSLLIVRWFGVPLEGDLVTLVALTVPFLFSAIGLGVLVATVSRTLQQALLLSFFGLFPIMFLSGTMVPVESMPRALQIASLASPLRHYLDIVLGIFLKGSGIGAFAMQAAFLTIEGLLLLGASAVAFRRLVRSA